MRTIHFKNGEKIEVSQDVINSLSKSISKGCSQFQIFNKKEATDIQLIINVTEINYVK